MTTTTGKKLFTAIACVLGTAALSVLAPSVQAAEQDPPSKTVHFADLNIQSPEGAKALYGRIRAAAQAVCQGSIGSDPVLREATHACLDKAIDNAVKKVDAPYLTALRFGGSNVRLASK